MLARAIIAVGVVMALTGCGRGEPGPVRRIEVDPLPPYARPLEETPVKVVPLSEAAAAKLADIRSVIDADSLSRLSRLADSEPGFISNFGGASNRSHWDLLRRTGFDPLARLGDLLDQPYGVLEVGDIDWYVWPDLAALPPEDLVPERLSFRDRARLQELVGETGIERIRAGAQYPGIRTAISADGHWLYYVHETLDE